MFQNKTVPHFESVLRKPSSSSFELIFFFLLSPASKNNTLLIHLTCESCGAWLTSIGSWKISNDSAFKKPSCLARVKRVWFTKWSMMANVQNCSTKHWTNVSLCWADAQICFPLILRRHIWSLDNDKSKAEQLLLYQNQSTAAVSGNYIPLGLQRRVLSVLWKDLPGLDWAISLWVEC